MDKYSIIRLMNMVRMAQGLCDYLCDIGFAVDCDIVQNAASIADHLVAHLNEITKADAVASNYTNFDLWYESIRMGTPFYVIIDGVQYDCTAPEDFYKQLMRGGK
jgi:hypothetical protein